MEELKKGIPNCILDFVHKAGGDLLLIWKESSTAGSIQNNP
jgi:hypothetical protein